MKQTPFLIKICFQPNSWSNNNYSKKHFSEADWKTAIYCIITAGSHVSSIRQIESFIFDQFYFSSVFFTANKTCLKMGAALFTTGSSTTFLVTLGSLSIAINNDFASSWH